MHNIRAAYTVNDFPKVRYLGVTFKNGRKDIYVCEGISTWDTEDNARLNSMDFSFCKHESKDGHWTWFYRGQRVKVAMIQTDYILGH